MLFILILLLHVYCFTLESQLIWMTGNADFLSSTYGSAVGYYNESIYMLGGDNQYDIIQYNIRSQTYYKLNPIHPTYYGTHFGTCFSQSYTQIGDIVYMLPTAENVGIAFDLSTQRQIITNGTNNYFPAVNIRNWYRCITNYQKRLLLTGGYDLSQFWIFDTTNNTWTSGPPLLHKRYDHSCSVVGDILYIIGGYDGSSLIDNVQYLNIGINGTWTQLTDRLTNAKNLHRSVVFNTNIYVIGGTGLEVNDVFADVDVIDTISGRIYIDSYLKYGVFSEAAIVVDNIIYVFAGRPTDNNDFYQYAVIPTTSPTDEPTTSPTKITISPTATPTTSPIITPTTSPTKTTTLPTVAPTISPIITPTTSPTNVATETLVTPLVIEYNKEIRILYQITNLSTDIVNKVTLNEVQISIISFIETSYINVSYLKWTEFEIIVKTHYIYIQDNKLRTLNLNTSVLCRDDAVQMEILFLSLNSSFKTQTENKLKHYFNDTLVQFNATVIGDISDQVFHFKFHNISKWIIVGSVIFIVILMCIVICKCYQAKKLKNQIQHALL